MSQTLRLLDRIWSSLGGSRDLLHHVGEEGRGSLSSAFAVSDFAAASVAAAGLALGELVALRDIACPDVSVDRRLASFWFAKSIRPVGWSLPPQWDPVAGNYRARDGWVRLHTNADRHRNACLRVLDCEAVPDLVRKAVEHWSADDLQEAVIAEGGVAARMLCAEEWASHPQGRAVQSEPLCHRQIRKGASLRAFGTSSRPLSGIRILDLTRILAGPVATRFLAGYGADVLRIDPPHWDEPAVLPEVTVGKRRARLNLTEVKDRAVFEQLLRQADVIVHGYRTDALDKLGFGAQERYALNPDLIDVALNAYGWTGPWAARRGFDTVVQMSAGLAESEMRHSHADQPCALPVQLLDYGTGHMMAAAVLRALTEARQGLRTQWRFSLARTALELSRAPGHVDAPFAAETVADLNPAPEKAFWGDAYRLKAPLRVGDVPLVFDHLAGPLGTDPPSFCT